MRREVLRGNQVDEVLLALLLLRGDHGKLQSHIGAWWRESYLLDDVVDSGVGFLKVLGEHLQNCQSIARSRSLSSQATFCCASSEVAYPRHCRCSILGWFVAAVRRASWLKGALHTDLRDAIAAGCIPGTEGALRPLNNPQCDAGPDIRKRQQDDEAATSGNWWRGIHRG